MLSKLPWTGIWSNNWELYFYSYSRSISLGYRRLYSNFCLCRIFVECSISYPSVFTSTYTRSIRDFNHYNILLRIAVVYQSRNKCSVYIRSIKNRLCLCRCLTCLSSYTQMAIIWLVWQWITQRNVAEVLQNPIDMDFEHTEIFFLC